MQVAGKTGSGSTAGLVPRTPPQPKESHRPSPDPSRQSEAQPQPAFQRHVMPCTTKAVSYSSCADVQQSNCPCSPCRQYQAHSPPRQPQQQQMQRCSSKSNAVLNNVVHQPGCDLLQRCNVDDAVGNGRWQPSVRYCLSSGEPAVTAGVWEEQATR